MFQLPFWVFRTRAAKRLEGLSWGIKAGQGEHLSFLTYAAAQWNHPPDHTPGKAALPEPPQIQNL